MIELILFVVACFVLQGIKDLFRGPKVPEVTLSIGELHAIARCGCDTVNGKVTVPCAAHRALMEAQRHS